MWAYSEKKIEDVRPRKEVVGKRKIPIPVAAAAASGIPFLRMGGRQSGYLGRVVRDLAKRRGRSVKRVERTEVMIGLGQAEDGWEEMVGGVDERQGGWEKEGREVLRGLERQVGGWERISKRRAEGLVKIVEGEIEAWERERVERRREKKRKRIEGGDRAGVREEEKMQLDVHVGEEVGKANSDLVGWKPF